MLQATAILAVALRLFSPDAAGLPSEPPTRATLRRAEPIRI